MALKMAPNSMFAVLLRNPWWVSFLIAGVISLLCAALLSREWVVVGILSTLPFWVIGCVALVKQWHLPSEAAQEAERIRLGSMSWRDFSAELASKFEKQGHSVERFKGKAAEGAADFLLTKNGQTTLVAAKRYKAATQGIEALQALSAQQTALGADRAIYVCLGALSEQAEKYAKDEGIAVGVVNFPK
jgi:restriction system protein